MAEVKLTWVFLIKIFLSSDIPWYHYVFLHKYVTYYQMQFYWLLRLPMLMFRPYTVSPIPTCHFLFVHTKMNT